MWHRSPRPSRADEKARRKEIAETFGKEVAKTMVFSKVEFEDLRTEERKNLVAKLQKEIDEYDEYKG